MGDNGDRMTQLKNVKVSLENYTRLTKLMLELAAKRGKRQTMDDAVNYLLDNAQKEAEKK